ncbi:hypothetical protein RB195_018098 [Necator americanus]|uniref:Uncharacterized protein n=1 Tax=Necator americanus TaxID=51031 RepID=A0ABR1CAE8_NECAM
MWEPLTELLHHFEKSQSIAHGEQRTAKTVSKIPHTFIWMLLRQILQFVERYCSRSTRARLIFEFLVSGFEAMDAQTAQKGLQCRILDYSFDGLQQRGGQIRTRKYVRVEYEWNVRPL